MTDFSKFDHGKLRRLDMDGAPPVKREDMIYWAANAFLAFLILFGIIIDSDDAAGCVVIGQCIVAFSVFTVMTVRYNAETSFRGGDAKTLEEEFEVYGYPPWACKVVRIVKTSLAVLLILGLVYPPVMPYGAFGILALMVGAAVSHMKVGDHWYKSVPSATLGLLCLCMLIAYMTDNAGVTDPTSIFACFATWIARLLLFAAMTFVCGAMAARTFGVKSGHEQIDAAVDHKHLDNFFGLAGGSAPLLQS